MKSCLVPGCKKQAHARGLCTSHYSFAFEQVSVKGRITWKELEKNGKCLPPKHGCNSENNKWFFDK